VLVEAGQAAGDRDQGLLAGVEGVGVVAREAAAQGVEAVVVTAQEVVERLPVTRPCRPDQI
jgi:hypothetical protein